MPAAPTLPPVTDAHRQQALQVMGWHGWTLAMVRRDAIRARVLECLAARIRTREWQADHARGVTLVRRLNPATGQWCTQRLPGPYTDEPCLPGIGNL